MAQAFQFISCHALTRQQLAPALTFIDPEIKEVVNGGAIFSGSIALPRNTYKRDQLRAALEPDEAALYARAPDGSWPFGGPIIAQDWDKRAGRLDIVAESWRNWAYDVFAFTPTINLSGDSIIIWSQKDQLTIARDIILYLSGGGPPDGRPIIQYIEMTSGKLRDLTVKGLEFRYTGELLDSIAQRSGGFEWDILPVPDQFTGLPRPRLTLGYPEIGGAPVGLLFRHTPEGGNMTLSEPIKKQTKNRRTRIWTTGSTEQPDQNYAVDSDPGIATSSTLLRERATNYSTVINRTTLASHARAERAFRSPKTNAISVTVTEGAYPVWQYKAGDRARVIIEDDWYSLDLTAARILERNLKPRDGAGTVDMVIDLSDTVMPEVDSGGVV